jgi:SapC
MEGSDRMRGETSMSDTQVPPPANDTTPAGMPLFYKDPRPLDPSVLGGYGLKRGKGFSFSTTCHAIPISLTEFPLVQKHYPIVFASGDPPLPLAALSLTRDENLFVDAEGNWADDHYVPAYVRRYPFVLGEMPNENRMFLCVDVASDLVTNQNPDVPFFDGQKPTEIVNQALELCRRFHEDLVITKAYCLELQKQGLLRETQLNSTGPDGQQVVAGSFITIDPQTFDQLSDTVFTDFRRRGILPPVYMQQSSQSNWARLAMRKQRMMTDGAGSRAFN